MSIPWTKSWSPTDDGTIIKGADLKNIQDDVSAAVASSAIPSQSGNAGKVLGTDGSTLSWTTAAALTRGTFTNSDLVAGVLTVTHTKALTAPFVMNVVFFDNNAKQVFPDVTGLTNTLTADFTNFGALTGTWGYAYAS